MLYSLTLAAFSYVLINIPAHFYAFFACQIVYLHIQVSCCRSVWHLDALFVHMRCLQSELMHFNCWFVTIDLEGENERLSDSVFTLSWIGSPQPAFPLPLPAGKGLRSPAMCCKYNQTIYVFHWGQRSVCQLTWCNLFRLLEQHLNTNGQVQECRWNKLGKRKDVRFFTTMMILN